MLTTVMQIMLDTNKYAYLWPHNSSSSTRARHECQSELVDSVAQCVNPGAWTVWHAGLRDAARNLLARDLIYSFGIIREYAVLRHTVGADIDYFTCPIGLYGNVCLTLSKKTALNTISRVETIG